MRTHKFPLNYDYSSKLMGLFEYKIILPLTIFGFIFFHILGMFELNLINKLTIFITTFIPLFLLLNTKIYKEPLLSFLISIIKHFIFSGTYSK